MTLPRVAGDLMLIDWKLIPKTFSSPFHKGGSRGIFMRATGSTFTGSGAWDVCIWTRNIDPRAPPRVGKKSGRSWRRTQKAPEQTQM